MYIQNEDDKIYQKARNEILNDTHRKQLFKKLFELYSNALPVFIKKENGDIICSYTEDIENLADAIKEQIRERDNQIYNLFNIKINKQL